MQRVTSQRRRFLSILAALSVFCSVFVSLPIAFAQEIRVTDLYKTDVHVIGFEEVAVANSHAARSDVKFHRASISLPPNLTLDTSLFVESTVKKSKLQKSFFLRTSQTFGRAPPRVP